MMNRLIIGAAAMLALTSCGQIGGLASGVLGGGGGEPATQENLTRAQIEQSGIALIRVKIGEREPTGRFYIAQADNNGTVTYGKDDRAFFVMRGGLLVGTHSIGNDVITVKSNPNDPIQAQRPVSQWPSSVSRTYQLAGDGLNGQQVEMRCRYQNSGSGQIEIVEQVHSATLMTEICTSDIGTFENSYMVGANGFIWKSEQFAGRGTEQVVIEIVEPLT